MISQDSIINVLPWTDTVATTLSGSVKSLPYFFMAFITVALVLQGAGSKSKLPLLNAPKIFEIGAAKTKEKFVKEAKELLSGWFRTNPTRPIRVISDFGEVTVLPPNLADEIRNDPRLSFGEVAREQFHDGIAGFEPLREGNKNDSALLKSVINNDLTKWLNKVIEPLATETAMAVPELFTNSKEWHTIPLRDTLLKLVARISSRVFLGEELCRNEAWLKVTTQYTTDSFSAAEKLRLWPRGTRRIASWFLPYTRILRAEIDEARSIMGPVLAKRQQLKAAALAEGRTLDFNDAIDWFERNSKGEKYDPVAIQLILSMVAIHTTTDLVTQVMLDLTFNPEILESLRSEINTLICKEGWKKTTLYNMKLLDSVIKESQRMKPIQMASLFRKATAGFELSDGTKIRKGERVVVSSHSMWDPKVYDNPERWHGDRFYRMRDSPGKAHLAQLVSTSPQHLGFGHGQHACPGRFFAANEIKIALVFILSQYEWKLPVGAQPEVMKWGFNTSADPFMKVEIRRRPEQFDLPLPLDRQSPADDATTIA